MQKVLVPIDSIEYDNTLEGVKNAIKYASGCKVDQEEPELIFLHVIHSSSRVPMDEKEKLHKMKKRKIDEEFEAIKEMCEDHNISNVRTIFREGEPDKKIIETSKEENADLIVIGSGKLHDKSARGRITRFVYGSVTEDVLHEAPCSVLVTRGYSGEDIDVCSYVPC